MHLRANSLFMLLIIWQAAKCKALQNQSAIIKEKQDLSILNITENIPTNLSSKGQINFYELTPDFLYSHASRRSMQLQTQPKVSTQKINIENDIEISINKLIYSLRQLQFKPVVILVDDTEAALKDAIFFSERFLKSPNVFTEFWLMKFNASGVTTVTAKSRLNPEEIIKQLKSGLNNVQNNNVTKGTATFFAVLRATQILPVDTEILLFTNRFPIDEDLSPLTVINLNGKKLRLHIIWSGIYPSIGHEEKLLEQAVAHTNGYFLLGNTFKTTSTLENLANSSFNEIMGTKEIIIMKKNITNDYSIFIPVDRSVQYLDILIKGVFTSAILISPTGYTVDLLNVMSVRRLSPSASSAHEPKRWARVQFNTAKVTATRVIGIWEMRTNGLVNDKIGYNITIYAETELKVHTEILPTIKQGFHVNQSINNKEFELEIKGNFIKIDNITFLDIFGQEINQIPENIVRNIKNKDYMLSDEETEHVIKTKLSEQIPKDSFYVKVNGINNYGEKFSRLSNVNQNKILSRKLPMILIETSIRSELIITPGSNPKIIFDVINNYDYATTISFTVEDERSMLRDLNPKRLIVGPKQSIEVVVSTIIPPSTSLDFTNLVTLTAYTQERVQKSAMMYITNNKNFDNKLPYLYYDFTTNCMEVSKSSCQAAFWTLEVTAQDSESGLLQVSSIPAGIFSPNGYISGTKDTVMLYYSSNCCQSEVDVTATDLNGNRRTFRVDAYNAGLSTASIVAVTLGVIILLVIIIVIIVLIWRKCKQSESLDLPRYRGQTGTSRF